MAHLQLCVLVIYLLACSLGEGGRGPHHPRGTPQAHKHYRPQRPDGSEEAAKITQDTNLLQDSEHIREDLGEWSADVTKNMTPEELEFHYFKVHDFDNNTKLDGLEILHAIQHTMREHDESDEEKEGGGEGEPHGHDHEEMTPEQQLKERQQREEDILYFSEMIDRVLAEDDLDNDGFLNYVEYVVGRQRDDRRRGVDRKSR